MGQIIVCIHPDRRQTMTLSGGEPFKSFGVSLDLGKVREGGKHRHGALQHVTTQEFISFLGWQKHTNYFLPIQINYFCDILETMISPFNRQYPIGTELVLKL
jgi:hypothetical protein